MGVTRPFLQRVSAALVHIYTGLGGVLGIYAIRAIDESDFRQAFLLIFFATMIDYTDGPLARRVDARRIIPIVDGDKLDTAIDFVVNVIVPIYLLLRANRLPSPHWLWCSLALLPSLYRFANANQHRSAGFFLGMPPIFVLPAFFAFFVPHMASLLITLYAVLCFVPLGYIHVNRFKGAKLFNGGIVMLWWLAYLAITQGWVAWTSVTAVVSILPLVTYVAVSITAFAAYRHGLSAPNE